MEWCVRRLKTPMGHKRFIVFRLNGVRGSITWNSANLPQSRTFAFVVRWRVRRARVIAAHTAGPTWAFRVITSGAESVYSSAIRPRLHSLSAACCIPICTRRTSMPTATRLHFCILSLRAKSKTMVQFVTIIISLRCCTSAGLLCSRLLFISTALHSPRRSRIARRDHVVLTPPTRAFLPTDTGTLDMRFLDTSRCNGVGQLRKKPTQIRRCSGIRTWHLPNAKRRAKRLATAFGLCLEDKLDQLSPLGVR